MNFRQYFQSMAGRLFVFLLIGVIGSASLALGMADTRRISDLHRIRLGRLVDRLDDFLSVAGRAPEPLRTQLLTEGVPGIRRSSGAERITQADPELARALSLRTKSVAQADRALSWSCFGPSPVSAFSDQFNCWVVTARLTDGELVKLQVRGPHGSTADLPELDPLFVLISAIAVAGLAFFAARMAAAPLKNLSRAAQALGGDLDTLPLPERGPYEVREAAQAFNAMQARLRDHVTERTHMLASITHDLQTPMTRLRLRLEKVQDPALRSRLIDDLGAMQALIREGLDYSRSNQTNEPFAPLALDHLLDILVDDATDAGKAVTFARRSGCDVEARPRALQRCLGNLLDNALKYGGSADVTADWIGREVHIRIRDHGPGIPPDKVDLVLKPFVRLDPFGAKGIDGVGLGLTIAKTLADKNEAELVLRNHPQGGLEASLILRRGVAENLRPAPPASAPGKPPLPFRDRQPRRGRAAGKVPQG
ncbi:two-component sensor histidine kinase [Phenylobacterium hankyongense]|uniref:histidine kinase n=1 Tax=Phenylobacterium hankyongense TaxID=1813876 RepID=A0A328B321_9CAUL|nr:ATP-binding protein [Phenylobacterium hankyongense]RAK60244.1 two-component sensor histidine kinase [Phenylobacterium hankyongense]